LLCWVQFLLCI